MRYLAYFFAFAITFSLLLAIARASERRRRPVLGIASWYGGDAYRGKFMANGERFDPAALTCASWDHPFGTRLRVYRADGYYVDVTVTDRGPAKHLRRVIDLSEAAFARLAPLRVGLLKVEVAVLDENNLPVIVP